LQGNQRSNKSDKPIEFGTNAIRNKQQNNCKYTSTESKHTEEVDAMIVRIPEGLVMEGHRAVLIVILLQTTRETEDTVHPIRTSRLRVSSGERREKKKTDKHNIIEYKNMQRKEKNSKTNKIKEYQSMQRKNEK
jgi:hypothetical protein